MKLRTGQNRLRKVWTMLLAVLITLVTIPAGMLMTASPVYADTISVKLQKGSTPHKYGGTGVAYHYTVTVNGRTRQAYCLQPAEMPPDVGSRKAAKMPDSSKVARTMYYCYGYPGQKKLAKWLKAHGHSSHASGIDFYVLCHVLLSYQYQPSTAFVGWNGPNPNTKINKSYQDMVKAAAKYVNSLPDPAGFDSSIRFSSTKGSRASASWNGSEFKSDKITLVGHEDNYVEYTVPSGMTLAMDGKTYKAGAKVEIDCGVPFKLSSTDRNKAGTTYSSGTLHGNLQDYTAYKITDSGTQNIAENARTALNQTDYQKRYDDLAARYDKLKNEIAKLSDTIQETQSRKASVEDFLKAFEKTPDALTEFSLDTFNGLVDHLTVYAKDDIRVTFRNGQEIKA